MGLSFSPPLVPPTTLAYLDTPVSVEKYAGKRILSIHGKGDELVPYEQGREEIEAIRDHVNGSRDGKDEGQGDGGVMEVKVLKGAGHVLVPDMIPMVADWVWRWALSDTSEAVGGGGEGKAKSRI